VTIEQLRAKRDEILQTIGTTAVRFGERSVEYGNAKDALATIDAEIAKAESASAGTASKRTSYATFSND
jgi:hypothetical protein